MISLKLTCKKCNEVLAPTSTKLCQKHLKLRQEWQIKYRLQRKNNPYLVEKDNKNARERKKHLAKKYKLMCYQHYSKKDCNSNIPCCACCHNKIEVFLTIDHISGVSQKYPREEKGISLYRKIIKNKFPPNEFQILCRNCNIGKERNGGHICPHKQILKVDD